MEASKQKDPLEAAAPPETVADFRAMLVQIEILPPKVRKVIVSWVDLLVQKMRRGFEESKAEALRILNETHREKVAELEHDLKLQTSRLSSYYEQVIEELGAKRRVDSRTFLADTGYFDDLLGMYRTDGRLHTFALAVVDIDNFKTEINDQLGHHVGDLVIDKIAEFLRLSLRIDRGDIARRSGGDEFQFFIYNPQTDKAARAIAQRFTGRIANFDWTQFHPDLKFVSVSVGCVMVNVTDRRREELERNSGDGKHGFEPWIIRADELMYRNKKRWGGAERSSVRKVHTQPEQWIDMEGPKRFLRG